MLHIILTILKIAGILILCVLALLILLLTLVLAVPVRYRVKAVKGEEFSTVVKATWLMHLVSVRFSYGTDGFTGGVRILGIPLMKGKQKPDKPSSRRRREDASEEPKAGDAENARNPAQTKKGSEPAEESPGPVRKKKSPDAAHGEETQRAEDLPEKEDAQEESAGFFQKLLNRYSRFLEKIRKKVLRLIRTTEQKIHKIRYTFSEICDKIKNILENIAYYRDLFALEQHKNALLLVRGQAFRLLRHIGPRKVRGVLEIGFEDPAATGQFLAVAGIFYPFYGENIRIIPDFGHAVLLGELYIKGRVTLAVLLFVAAKVYFNKDLKHLLSALKKEEA